MRSRAPSGHVAGAAHCGPVRVPKWDTQVGVPKILSNLLHHLASGGVGVGGVGLSYSALSVTEVFNVCLFGGVHPRPGSEYTWLFSII